jgi:hypothetical protein
MEGALVSSSETAELNPRETILFESGSFKRDRFGCIETVEAPEWRFAKVSRSDTMATNSFFPNSEGQMLSFASPNADASLHSNYYNSSNQSYLRNEGMLARRCVRLECDLRFFSPGNRRASILVYLGNVLVAFRKTFFFGLYAAQVRS